MRKNILQTIALFCCVLLCACDETIDSALELKSARVEPLLHSGLYLKVDTKIEKKKNSAPVLSAGVCYIFNGGLDLPTIDDQIIEATEIDSEGNFSVYFTDYSEQDYIIYRPYARTKDNVYYGEKGVAYISSLASQHNCCDMIPDQIRPHHVEVAAQIEFGPVDPAGFDYYFTLGDDSHPDIEGGYVVKGEMQADSLIHATLTGLNYRDDLNGRVYVRRHSDSTLFVASYYDIRVPQLDLEVTTCDAPKDTLNEGMVLSGKVNLKFAEVEDLKFYIHWFCPYGSKTLEATFNELDSTFSVILPKLHYLTEYEYHAYVEYPYEYTFYSIQNEGDKHTFTTPKPNLPAGAVDLGLSVRWNSVNLGATAPEEMGLYYQWADPTPKTEEEVYKTGFGWDSYQYGTASHNITKYCFHPEGVYQLGTPDGKSILEPCDDAATVNLGSDWRTPSIAEWLELRKECEWSITKINNQEGYVVESTNGNAIFLPYQKYGYYSEYWTNAIDPNRNPSNAVSVDLYHFEKDPDPDYDLFLSYTARCEVLPVRAVRK